MLAATHWQRVEMLPILGRHAYTKITPTQEFCVGNHQQIVDTVVLTDTVIRTYCSIYLPQQVVAIQ